MEIDIFPREFRVSIPVGHLCNPGLYAIFVGGDVASRADSLSMSNYPIPAFGGEIIEDLPAHQTRRRGEDSADRREPRDVEPRRDLVTFLDEPDQKKFTNKRKRTRLNKGGMFFNARDRQIILFVAAHGWLSIRQLCDFCGGVSPNALRHSLKRLVDHKLLNNSSRGLSGEILYIATTFGLRKAGAEGFNGAVVPRLQTYEHKEAITALHIHSLKNQNTKSIFMTERELFAAASSGVISPRILASAPWVAEYKNPELWLPKTITPEGKASSKRPDGLFLRHSNGEIQPPRAVEIERTVKSKASYYIESTLAYANAANDKYLDSIVTYIAPSSDNTLKTLKKSLVAVYDRSNSGFVWPAHLPKIKYELINLDTFYTPYSAIRGWIPRASQ